MLALVLLCSRRSLVGALSAALGPASSGPGSGAAFPTQLPTFLANSEQGETLATIRTLHPV